MKARSILLDGQGTLRAAVLLVVAVGLPVVILGLASIGGWGGMVAILIVLGSVVTCLIRFGDGVRREVPEPSDAATDAHIVALPPSRHGG